MAQPSLLAKQFSDLYDGSPWIDVTIVSTLEEITAKEASTKPMPRFNSIWEIVNHMIAWRETVLARMGGEEIPAPDDNYFTPLRDRSEAAWVETRMRLAASQEKWVKSLKKLKQKDLASLHPSGTFTHFDLIVGILEHDAYHLGQIRLVLKQVQFT